MYVCMYVHIEICRLDPHPSFTHSLGTWIIAVNVLMRSVSPGKGDTGRQEVVDCVHTCVCTEHIVKLV